MALPLDLLEAQVGKQVSLLLKDGRLLAGRLAGFDPHMNLVLDEVKETGKDGSSGKTLGTLVLRGNNVVSIGTS